MHGVPLCGKVCRSRGDQRRKQVMAFVFVSRFFGVCICTLDVHQPVSSLRLLASVTSVPFASPCVHNPVNK